MVPINALWFYEQQLENEYLYREEDYTDDEELDIEGEMNNRRDERDYEEFLEEN